VDKYKFIDSEVFYPVKKQLVFLCAVILLALSGCGNNKEHENHSNMKHKNHSSSSEVPKGLKNAENPTYKVGSKVIIKADHMEGMDSAKATIAGAYDTTVYTISYTPTTGGKRLTNHKWIVQEEVKNFGDKPYKSGDEVTITADHMKGMKDAKATIDSAEQTTVYMIDYTPTTGGKEMKNHKWVTESELSPDKS
jgi:hypothetical protein